MVDYLVPDMGKQNSHIRLMIGEQLWVVNLGREFSSSYDKTNQSYSCDERGTVLGGELW